MRFCDQRQRGVHESRVVGRMTQVLREGFVGRGAHVQRAVVIAERAPGLEQFRLEMHRPAQRRDGLLALAETPQRQSRQRQRIRLVGMDLQDLIGLLGRGRRITLQQARGVRQRDLQRAMWCGAVAHGLTTSTGVLPDRPVTITYQNFRLS